MTNEVTYRIKDLSRWNTDRPGEIELDALARVYLGDPEITGRDRIAFALRELRKRGYDVEAQPVDWTRPMMICSVMDSIWMAFGEPQPSRLYRRLDRIAQRTRLVTDEGLEHVVGELYRDEDLHDRNDFLEEPYVFSFKGDPVLGEGVFQAVGFATRRGIMVPDDGSETHYHIEVAPPTLICG
jgi:hypothetical protein